MSIFGQVWLWSAVAFLLGVLLTWVFLVRPAQARSTALERRLQAAQAQPKTSDSAAQERRASTRTFEREGMPEPVPAVPAASGASAVPGHAGIPSRSAISGTPGTSGAQAVPGASPLPGAAEGMPEPAWHQQESFAGSASDSASSVLEPESANERTSIFRAQDTSLFGPPAAPFTPSELPPRHEHEEPGSSTQDEPRKPGRGSLFDPSYEPGVETKRSGYAFSGEPSAEAERSPYALGGEAAGRSGQAFGGEAPAEAGRATYAFGGEPSAEAERAGYAHGGEPSAEGERAGYALGGGPSAEAAPSGYAFGGEPSVGAEQAGHGLGRAASGETEAYALGDAAAEPPSYGLGDAAAADPSAYAFSDEPAAAADEPAADATHVLPRRQPRTSPPGGFEPPKPVQPSMRPMERREPLGGNESGRSGSLFEPVVRPHSGGAHSAPEPPPARSHAESSAAPAGPFGPGSAMPMPGGASPSDDFTVKASVTALRYCTEESPQFPRMVAEVWFRSAADAERVGFRPLS